MAKYTVEFSCGHTETIQLYGPHKHREERIAWLDRNGHCGACYPEYKRKQREAAAEKAAAANAARELAPLTGSEAQIQWAELLRDECLTEILPACDRQLNDPNTSQNLKAQIANGIAWLSAQSSASWWIDNRDVGWFELLRSAAKAPADPGHEAALNQAELALRAETTLRPPNPVTESVATVEVRGDTRVVVTFPERREEVRTLMRENHFEWERPHWVRRVSMYAGPADQRLREIGVKLLAAGVPVCIVDDKARADVAAGQYDLERYKWVTVDDGAFLIVWRREAGDYYPEARLIPTARWHKPGMRVAREYADDVADFASIHGFEITPVAKALIEGVRDARARTQVAAPEPLRHSKHAGDRAVPRLDVPDQIGVPDNLRDQEESSQCA